MGNWKTLHDEGYSRASQGDMKAAEDFLMRAIEEARKSGRSEEMANSQNCLAVVYKQDGRGDEARTLFESIIEAQPPCGELGSAYSGLAELMCEKQMYSKALKLFDQAVENFIQYRLGLDLHFAECSLLQLIPLMLNRVKERELEEAELLEINDAVDQGFRVLGLDSNLEPQKVVEALDHHVDKAQDEIVGNMDSQSRFHETGEVLALLWGQQLVKRFGWQWTYVRLSKAEVLAVASPDRSQIVYPLHFLCECFEDPELDCTIKLAFEMLCDEDSPEGEANEYENIMESVFRIVPKEGRTRSLAAARLPE